LKRGCKTFDSSVRGPEALKKPVEKASEGQHVYVGGGIQLHEGR